LADVAVIVMATLGYRGRVEIRDRGLPVDLTDETPTPWKLPLAAAQPESPIASRISATSSLASLEAAFADLYHINEVDYERQKAATLTAEVSQGGVDATGFLQAASERSVQWVTRRRLREATGTLPDNFARELLIPTG
jgi:hypothetical protein